MPKLNDLTGKKFGRLTVLQRDTSQKFKNVKWICKCECGNIKSIQGSNLISGLTQSCGCLHKSKISSSLIGQRFGKLTVIKDSGERNSCRNILWECQCDCGNTVKVPTSSLKRGYTHSCGCLKESVGEYQIEKILEENRISYKREFTFKDLKQDGNYFRFDFAIFNKNGSLSHLIEFDGECHYLVKNGWSTPEKVLATQSRDKIKTEYCANHGIRLIRIPYTMRDKLTISDLI